MPKGMEVWPDGDIRCHRDRTASLVTSDTLDVDDPLLAVHLDDLALATLVVTPHDSHLVVLADRNRANLMVRRERGEEVSAC